MRSSNSNSPPLSLHRVTHFAFFIVSTPFADTPHNHHLAPRQMEARMGYDHYLGGDSESDEIRQGDGFVVVCGYGRIGRLVCELLGKKFINFVAFDNNPLKAMEARNR